MTAIEQTLDDIRPPFNFEGSAKEFTHEGEFLFRK